MEKYKLSQSICLLINKFCIATGINPDEIEINIEGTPGDEIDTKRLIKAVVKIKIEL